MEQKTNKELLQEVIDEGICISESLQELIIVLMNEARELGYDKGHFDASNKDNI
jgi:hypothetical protein